MKKLLNKINCFNKIETISEKNKGVLCFGMKTFKLSFGIFLFSLFFNVQEFKAQVSCSGVQNFVVWNGSNQTLYNGGYGGATPSRVVYSGSLYEGVSNQYQWYNHNGLPGSFAWWVLLGTCCTDRTVGAASSSPSPCTGSVMTSITHATTNVTAVGTSSNLPAGVTASYSGNVITISGTPTVAGTYNYTITPTSSCGSATATGTITVTANVKANNTTNLNVAGSWSCGVPTSTTLGTWTSTVTGANTTSLGGNVSCLGVVLTSPGGLVTINSGNTLSIFASGIDMSASTQSFTMNNLVDLAANQSWTVNTAKTLTSAAVVSGSFGITKAGAGALTLSGTNTFTGGVTHNAGTLNIGAAAALGTTAGTFTVAASTTINNTSGAALTTSNYPMTINGSFTFTGTHDLNLGTGAKALGATPTITASASILTLGGVVSGAFGITKAGAGTLVLSGTNTYSGTTTITAGTLQLGGVGVISNSSNIVMNGGTFSTGSGIGNNETVGTLTLSATSVISLGSASHTLNFAASNGTTWTGSALLGITGWAGNFNSTTGTSGKIFFGSSAELSPAKLAQISFYKAGGGQYKAAQLSTGEIVATNTLAVELIYFTGEVMEDKVLLSWQTAAEINNEKFIVEKSFDANNWFQIGEVKGAGNSANILNYSFVDDALIVATQYYRLTQIDFDGTKETFKIIDVSKAATAPFEINVFPNPMKEEVKVSFYAEKQGYSRFRIYAENGQEIYAALVGTLQGENSFSFNTSHLEGGIYIFKIEKENGVIISLKVVK